MNAPIPTRQRFDQVIEFMRTRRSVPAKALSAPGPDEDEVRQMVEIATRAPDHGKLAPWRLVRYAPDYCRRLGKACEERARELNGEMSEELREIERTRFLRAPVVIGVVSRAAPHPKIPEWEQRLSAAAVAMNLLIAANAFGWDAQWLTEWPAYDEKVRPLLGAGANDRIAGFVHIGTRTLPKTERDRPSIDDVFTVMEG